MDSAAREPPFMARERDTDESRCLMAILPPETKIQIMSYIGTQQSLSRLAQSCGAWYGPATQELYTRDAKEHRSFAIKWMAAHAVDEQTTDSALRTLETSRRWGGQIDAVKLRLPRSDDDYDSSQDQMLDGDLYGVTTALHFAVFLGNARLTKMLLDMKASLIIPCSNLLWRSMGSEQFLRRFGYFVKVLEQRHIGPAFPIFMAFLHSDADMCKLLIEHGAGREAIIFDPDTEPKVISILHLAAADPTTDYRQWQCLFDRFREYIDEPCPRESQSTPLHIALESGCIQGMQIAVEYGADKESKDGASHTPLSSAIRVRRPYHSIADRTRFDEHLRCLGKFVDLGGSVNPDGDSLIGFAVQRYSYSPFPVKRQDLRHLISFLLEHHADTNRTFAPKTNMVKEIIDGIYSYHNDPSSIELFKGLLSDLVDGGLNLAIPAPGLPSPLYRVLHDRNAKPEWLFDFLCENGATIHEREVDSAFLCWCKTWRLWETNKYDAWWQHQGQEDEMFLKWCEDPYNAWWWQHVKQISPLAVSRAYGYAVTRRQQLYDILTHLPLAAPLGDVLIKIASASSQLWSWRLVVLHEFEEDFLATWSSVCGNNMIHLTVNAFVAAGYRPPDYSAADAMQDILHLRDKGVDMNSRNFNGQTPLEVLLDSGKPSDGLMEVAALLEGKVQKVQELA